MLTFGELRRAPARIAELGGHDVLIAAAGGEVLMSDERPKAPDATMVFMHETIQMMKADRADRLDKLRRLLADGSKIVPLKKKDTSVWDHVTVGRAASSDIVLDDMAVSSMHAQFAANAGEDGLCVQDVGSSNGTFVNRERLQPHKPAGLKSGDCVRFGQSIFYYVGSGLLHQLLGLADP